MFAVGFGSANREEKIQGIAKSDHTTAVILAAVHFEWMLKRAILKLGKAPTKSLREELEGVFRINDRHGRKGYKSIWAREVGSRFKQAALGKVLGQLQRIQSRALDVRGKIVHGNGTVSERAGTEAVELFLEAGRKLREFAAEHDEDLDARLRPRRRSRVTG